MKIFIVNGQKANGKTTFEKMVKAIAYTHGIRIEMLSTIDVIKDICLNYLGWNGEKDKKGRKLLSDIKDALTSYNDMPYQYIKKKIQEAKDKDMAAVFIDCREPEEIERFSNDYGAITILVQRGELISCGNHADDNVNNYHYDIIVDNSRGLEELREEARIFEQIWIRGVED